MCLILVVLLALLSSSEESPKNSGLNCDSNPDRSDAGEVFHQLCYRANWDVIWVDELIIYPHNKQPPVGLIVIAQLVEHCTGHRRGQGSNPRLALPETASITWILFGPH